MNQVDRGHSVESRCIGCYLLATDFENSLHLSITFQCFIRNRFLVSLSTCVGKGFFLFARFNILNDQPECDRCCEGSQPNRKTGILRCIHRDRSGGNAAGLYAQGRAYARTGGAIGASHHGDVKQASPTLQQVINDLQVLRGIADISAASRTFS